MREPGSVFVRQRAAWALIVGVGLCVGSSAHALPVTFQFSGVVTVADEWVPGSLGGAIEVGDAFEGSYTFESTVVDGSPDPEVGDYPCGALPCQFTVTVGSLTFSGIGSSPLIYDRPTGDIYAVYNEVVQPNVPVGDALIFGVGLELLDPDAFSGTALPLTPPDLADFETARFGVWGRVSHQVPWSFYVEGTLASLTVPEPAPAALAASLLGLFAALRSPRSRSTTR